MTTKKKISLPYIVIYLILILWAFTTIFPFLWVVNNSFKSSTDVLRNSFSLPTSLTMDNYQNAFDKQNILNSYKQSLVISGTVMVGVMVLATMMAFALTRYKFKGKTLVMSMVSASLMFPIFATIIPVYIMMINLGLLNNVLSVILPQIAGNLSFACTIMMGFLRGLPIEMEEAAYMEGAGVWKVFTRIIVPLARPSLATVAIFSFLWSYNDMFVQLTMIKTRKNYPISALLSHISSQYGTDYGLMAASVTIILVPVFILYMFLQKNIIKGLTAGAVKG